MGDEVLDKFDEKPVIDALKEWAYSDPRKDEVFFAELRKEVRLALTPVEYYYHVKDHTEFGKSVLRFLFREADRHKVKPETFVRRATDNRRSPKP